MRHNLFLKLADLLLECGSGLRQLGIVTPQIARLVLELCDPLQLPHLASGSSDAVLGAFPLESPSVLFAHVDCRLWNR